MKFLIINGPNLNMLGLREPDIYGKQDFKALCALIEQTCAENGIECELSNPITRDVSLTRYRRHTANSKASL